MIWVSRKNLLLLGVGRGLCVLKKSGTVYTCTYYTLLCSKEHVSSQRKFVKSCSSERERRGRRGEDYVHVWYIVECMISNDHKQRVYIVIVK